jgi:hypothetical protein
MVDPFAGPCAGALELWAHPVPCVDAFEVVRARVSDYQLQLRVGGPEGLTWFGTRISAIDETELGTWIMEYLYDEVVQRRVTFEMARP